MFCEERLTFCLILKLEDVLRRVLNFLSYIEVRRCSAKSA